MEKDSIISKLNIKDYNKQLEDILTKKSFSEDVKNLLLSMLYKIETGYRDYKVVKINTKTKKEILEDVIEIIRKTEEIGTIKITNENKDKNIGIVLTEENKICTVLKESRILYLLCMLKKQEISSSDFLDMCLYNLLKKGNAISISELVRDFDGWSWNINTQDIEDIFCNFLYQSINIILNLNEIKEEDILTEICNLVEKKNFKKVFRQMLIIWSIKENEENKKVIEKWIIDIEEILKSMQDKNKYLQEITTKKENIEGQIKKLDIVLNDDMILKKQYISTNEKLEQSKRIFSLSDYSEMLEQKRQELMQDLEECTIKQNPENYIKEKNNLEEELNLLQEINLKVEESPENDKIILSFIEDIIYTLTKESMFQENKKSILDLIYKVRYYKLLPLNENINVMDVSGTSLSKLERTLITKACNLKVMTIISQDVKENYKVISQILSKRIIDLEKIQIKIEEKNGKFIVKIYDDKALAETIYFDKIKELIIKPNKKVQLLI